MDEAGFTWSDIADSAYQAYAVSTGNKNFRGDPMPDFKDLPEKIKIAWEVAVRHVGNCLVTKEEHLPNPALWAGWSPNESNN